MSLLNPTRKEIESSVGSVERDWGYADALLYTPCIEAVKRTRIRDIDCKTIREPVQTFLVNWGGMRRVLGRRERRNWKDDLLAAVKRHQQFLEECRDSRLEEVCIRQYQKEIKDCYLSFRKSVAPTSASKVLHLLADSFFPMWDEKIRNSIKAEGRTVSPSGKGFYEFVLVTQEFLNSHERTLNDLSLKYGKPKLKIVDEYMWKVCNA